VYWAQVLPGAILLGVAFGFLFNPTFGSVIETCIFGSQGVSVVGSSGYAMGRLTTCDEQLGYLTNGIITPLMFWIFLGLTITGGWLLLTGMQSRTLKGLKKAVST
jgi:hypothetical protein